MTDLEIAKSYSNIHGWFDIGNFHKYLKEKGIKIYPGEYHNNGDGNTHYLYYLEVEDNKIVGKDFQANSWCYKTYTNTIEWLRSAGIKFNVINNEQN